MKVFKELTVYFDDEEELKKCFLSTSYIGWIVTFSQEFNSLEFEYNGNRCEKATLFLSISRHNDKLARVSNIVPTTKFELSIEEYNKLLDLFYETYVSIIKKFRCEGPTSDVFDPLTQISETALRKLESFCNLANKSTGSSHPCDRERWLDFIMQTVIDNDRFDTNLLQGFLADKDYWGSNDKSWVMGRSAWLEEKAYELAAEYESFYDAMVYFREHSNDY